MKTILLLILITTSAMSNDKLVASINQTLQKVITKSEDKKIEDIKISYDPFNKDKPKKVAKESKNRTNPNLKNPQKHSTKLALSMIFNKTAFINGSWYKVNDKLADYRVVKINQDIVVLKKKNKYLKLKLPKSDTILITKEEI